MWFYLTLAAASLETVLAADNAGLDQEKIKQPQPGVVIDLGHGHGHNHHANKVGAVLANFITSFPPMAHFILLKMFSFTFQLLK